jgi:hypothetical protein
MWFADQQVNVFRHQDVTGDHKAVSHSHCLKLLLEDAVGHRVVQQRLSAVTTEGEKVEAAGLLVTNQLLWYDGDFIPVGWWDFRLTHPSPEKRRRMGRPLPLLAGVFTDDGGIQRIWDARLVLASRRPLN